MLAPNLIDADQEVRSIFISDLHLGSRFSRPELLLEFLERFEPEYLYLVGDIFDGWCLRRRWRWPETYNRLLDRLVEMAAAGTVIRLTPGNHDEFLRRFLMNNELVSIDNEFVHHGADQRRFIILHGDRFDSVESSFKWLSVAGNVGYEVILRLDFWTNRVLVRCGLRRRRISQTIKERVKHVVQFVSCFEERLLEHARERRCDAVVCGHIHMPNLKQSDELLYINLGDWVENSTALIEYGDGRLELVDADLSEPLAEAQPQRPRGRLRDDVAKWPTKRVERPTVAASSATRLPDCA